MPKIQESLQTGPDGKKWTRKVSKVQMAGMTMSVYERDVELLDWLSEYLGCSRSEAMRTAIRSLAGQLIQMPTK